MASVGDIFQVKVTGSLLGQLVNNVFWYRLSQADTVNTSFEQDLYDLFGSLGWSVLMEGIHTAYQNDSIEVINWSNIDEYTIGTSTSFDGQYASGEVSQSFTSLTFKSNKGNPGQRRSYKRIAGLPEQSLNGNTISDTTTPSYTPFAAFLPVELQYQAGQLFTPVQVKHSQTTAPYTPKNPYTMPPLGSGNPVVNRVLTGVWTYQIGTQNSRKPGYGA